jgi:hypothetical protein
MGDTTNWELAAAIAGVCIGLGGLVVLAAVSVFGTWRVFRHASEAAEAAANASVAVHDLAQQLALRPAQYANEFSLAASSMSGVAAHASDLLDKQSRLQDAVRDLVAAGALGRDSEEHGTLQASLRRIEAQLEKVAARLDEAARRQA